MQDFIVVYCSQPPGGRVTATKWGVTAAEETVAAHSTAHGHWQPPVGDWIETYEVQEGLRYVSSCGILDLLDASLPPDNSLPPSIMVRLWLRPGCDINAVLDAAAGVYMYEIRTGEQDDLKS